MGRSAVLMGLLSYSFVTVTLIADLGLPWHFYQLGLQSPEHSAMFEVSWCVGLYVTILLFEFLPVPFERWGLQKAKDIWQRWSGAYVAGALSLFVYLLSRNWPTLWRRRSCFPFSRGRSERRDKKAEPIMLAIAAVTFSTMHQSSLGSLFLLMPDKLAPQWWSPVLPVSFFLSSIAAGTSLVVLIEMWIAKAWGRQLQITQLAVNGQDLLLVALVLLGLSACRYGRSRPVRRCLFRKTGRPLRGRTLTGRYSSSGPTWPNIVARPPRSALSRHASRHFRCGFQPRERSVCWPWT